MTTRETRCIGEGCAGTVTFHMDDHLAFDPPAGPTREYFWTGTCETCDRAYRVTATAREVEQAAYTTQAWEENRIRYRTPLAFPCPMTGCDGTMRHQGGRVTYGALGSEFGDRPAEDWQEFVCETCHSTSMIEHYYQLEESSNGNDD